MKRLNGEAIFACIGGVGDDLIEESAAMLVISQRPKRQNPVARFLNSGWGVAILCAVVSLSAVMGIVWAGRQAPSGIPPAGQPSHGNGTNAEGDTAAETAIPEETLPGNVEWLGDDLVWVSYGVDPYLVLHQSLLSRYFVWMESDELNADGAGFTGSEEDLSFLVAPLPYASEGRYAVRLQGSRRVVSVRLLDADMNQIAAFSDDGSPDGEEIVAWEEGILFTNSLNTGTYYVVLYVTYDDGDVRGGDDYVFSFKVEDASKGDCGLTLQVFNKDGTAEGETESALAPTPSAPVMVRMGQGPAVQPATARHWDQVVAGDGEVLIVATDDACFLDCILEGYGEDRISPSVACTGGRLMVDLYASDAVTYEVTGWGVYDGTGEPVEELTAPGTYYAILDVTYTSADGLQGGAEYAVRLVCDAPVGRLLLDVRSGAGDGDHRPSATVTETEAEAVTEIEIHEELCVFDERLGEIQLKDCRFASNNATVGESKLLTKAIVDVDGDGVGEHVIKSPDNDCIVLRYYNGQVYSYCLDIMDFYNFNTDGTFYWYEASEDEGWICGLSQIVFDGESLNIKSIYSIKHFTTPTTYAYDVGGQAATEEEYYRCRNQNANKEKTRFSPFELTCSYPITAEQAWNLANTYWGNQDGYAEGAAGTVWTVRIVLVNTPNTETNDYRVVFQTEATSNVREGGECMPPHSIQLHDQIWVDAFTGEITTSA